MNKLLANTLLFALFPVSALSQTAITATFNEGVTYAPATASGETNFVNATNLSTVNNYDSGQIMKNLLYADNPSMEQTETRLSLIAVSGTTTSFTTQTFYPGSGGHAFIAANYVGGTISVFNSESGTGPAGCVQTVSSVSQTGSDGSASTITFTFPACTSAIQPGDFIVFDVVTQSSAPSCYLSGGATVGFTSSSPYDGAQSLTINTTATGSYAQCVWPFDTSNYNRFISLNGSYLAQYAVKGSVTFNQTVYRSTASSGAHSCNVTPTGTWALDTCSYTFSENSTLPASGVVNWQITQDNTSGTNSGINTYDDFDFHKTSSLDSTNTTIFRDEFVQYLRDSKYNGIRSWVYGNSMTYANAIKPYYKALQTNSNIGGTSWTPTLQWPDIWALCELLGARSDFETPITISNADMVNLIEYVGSTNTSTGGGAARLANGHSLPYIGATGTLPGIDFSIGNEPWNTGFIGQNANTAGILSNQYVSYFDRASSIISAARGDAAIDNNRMKFGCGIQTGDTLYYPTEFNKMHLKSGGACDFVEVNRYWTSVEANYQTIANQWAESLQEGYADRVGATNYANSYATITGITTAGPTGTATAYANIYEYANGTNNTCGTSGYPACSGTNNQVVTQAVLEQINSGAGNAHVVASKILNGWLSSVPNQNFFGAVEFGGSGSSAVPNTGSGPNLVNTLWGSVVDFGGATANLASALYNSRPVAFGMAIVNGAAFGATMHSCTTNAATYNFPADVNGPAAALNNVPYLQCTTFTDASGHRRHLYINSGPTAYTVTEAGSHPVTGTVTVTQVVTSNLNALNEVLQPVPSYSTPITDTSTTAPTVSMTTSSLTVSGALSIPAYSTTSFAETSTTSTHGWVILK